MLWPLLIWAVIKWQSRTAQHSTAQHNSLSLVRKLRSLLWILFFASFSFCVYKTPIDDKFAFYLLPARVWEFAAGGLLALYLLNASPTPTTFKRAWLGTALATLGLLLCVLAINFVDHNTLYFQGTWAVWPVGGTVALIAGLTLNRTGFWARFFSLRPLVWLGLLSYSWYLWHWPLLTIHKIYSLGGDTLTERIAVCLAALLSAYISYRFVERPVRERKPWLFATTKGSLCAAGLMVILMLGCSALVILNKNHRQSNPTHARLEAAKDDSAHVLECTYENKMPITLKVCGKISLEQAAPSQIKPVIVLWGDSHANHFYPTLVAMYPEHDIHKFALPGCPPVIDDNLTIYNNSEQCRAFNTQVITHIRTLGKQIDRVFLSARWPIYFGQTPVPMVDLVKHIPIENSLASMQTGVTNTLSKLADVKTKITVLGSTPELIYPAPKCLMLHPAKDCNVTKISTDANIDPSFTALQAAIKPLLAAELIDMRPFFCDAITCFASKVGRSLYTDDNHITGTTARELANYLKP